MDINKLAEALRAMPEHMEYANRYPVLFRAILQPDDDDDDDGQREREEAEKHLTEVKKPPTDTRALGENRNRLRTMRMTS